MKKAMKVLLTAMVLLLATGLAASSLAEGATYTIGIAQFAEHPSLDLSLIHILTAKSYSTFQHLLFCFDGLSIAEGAGIVK